MFVVFAFTHGVFVSPWPPIQDEQRTGAQTFLPGFGSLIPRHGTFCATGRFLSGSRLEPFLARSGIPELNRPIMSPRQGSFHLVDRADGDR
jgi:hypothetical protein